MKNYKKYTNYVDFRQDNPFPKGHTSEKECKGIKLKKKQARKRQRDARKIGR